MDKAPPAYDTAGYAPVPNMTQEQAATAPPLSQVQTTMFMGGPIPPANYGPKSQNTTCPSCRHVVRTRTRTKATSKTHCWACLLCPCLCCCLPHCMTSCVNTNHYCPNCDNFLGTYQS